MSDVQEEPQGDLVEEPVSEEQDKFAEEVAALGPAPGPGSSAAECDEYNYAVAEIEQRRVNEALDAEAEAADEDRDQQSLELTSQTRRPLNEDPRASFPTRSGDRATAISGDDGTGRAEGT